MILDNRKRYFCFIFLNKTFRTPLFYACLGGQAHVVEELCSKSHLIKNHVDVNGFTAIHCAVQAGSLACVKCLIRVSCILNLICVKF